MTRRIENPEFEKQLVLSASRCQVCKGAGYQAPPVLFAGHVSSNILIIGQNPGEFSKATPPDLLDKARTMFAENDAQELLRWYEDDLKSSRTYDRLQEVFGGDWLERYVYTNAVLCRTPGDASPSQEMATACSVWTNLLSRGKTAYVFIGRVAAIQMLGELGRTLPDGELKKWRGHLILFIYHPSAREWSAEKAAKYKRAFGRLTEKTYKEF